MESSLKDLPRFHRAVVSGVMEGLEQIVSGDDAHEAENHPPILRNKHVMPLSSDWALNEEEISSTLKRTMSSSTTSSEASVPDFAYLTGNQGTQDLSLENDWDENKKAADYLLEVKNIIGRIQRHSFEQQDSAVLNHYQMSVCHDDNDKEREALILLNDVSEYDFHVFRDLLDPST